MNKTEKIYEIAIIGAGPGGLTAALYAARAEADTVIIEKGAPGGKVVKTSIIENYPGVEAVDGFDLASKMFNQVMTLNVPFVGGGVEKVSKNNDIFTVQLDNGTEIKSKLVIVATGTLERKIGVDGEDRLYGKGVSYCAVCDGALYKDQEIMVVGGGLSALEEALYLTKFAKKVYLVHRRQGFRADDKTINKVKANSKIELILDAVVDKINGKDLVEEVIVKNIKNHTTTNFAVKAIFPYIGAIPITDFVEHFNVLDKEGYIEVDLKNKLKLMDY